MALPEQDRRRQPVKRAGEIAVVALLAGTAVGIWAALRRADRGLYGANLGGITGAQALKQLTRAGWVLQRRGGNHMIVCNARGECATIPYGKLGPGKERALKRLVEGRPVARDVRLS